MISAEQFINDRLGHEVDVDGYYGAQCWDLFAFFCQQADWPTFNCPITGYVKDIWNNRGNSGIMSYFEEAPVMQKGDWCIWDNCAACPDSHIAMFVSDNGDGTGQFLGQNQGGYGATIRSFPYEGTLGALRPKCYIEQVAQHKIGYRVHMAEIGWGSWAYDGEQAGTTGEERRVEAIQIEPMGLHINAKAHLQEIGWVDYGVISSETIIGTTGESRRLEALCLECEDATIIYQVHVAVDGWSAQSEADGIATLGSVGMEHAIEAIKLHVL